jgi:hypothetical protein
VAQNWPQGEVKTGRMGGGESCLLIFMIRSRRATIPQSFDAHTHLAVGLFVVCIDVRLLLNMNQHSSHGAYHSRGDLSRFRTKLLGLSCRKRRKHETQNKRKQTEPQLLRPEELSLSRR